MSIYRMRTEMGHYFKWILLLVVVPIFVIGGVFYFGPGGPAPEDERDRVRGDVIAKVNDAEITRGQFESNWDLMTDQYRSGGRRSALQFADLRMRVFQQLVNNQMILMAAKQLDVDVSDSAVEDEIEKAVTEYLKENRRRVLGKLSKERDASDPRDDDEYTSELEQAGLSLAKEIEMAKTNLPEDMVRAQMAQVAIGRKLEARTKPVTDRDVMASYNTYKIRQIVLRTGTFPKAQLMSRAKKVEQAAKGGADFAKLAADNSADPGAKRSGGEAVFSFETRFLFPEPVRDAVQKLKPGEVSGVLDTPYGIYVVKLESVEAKLPAKLDNKTKQARLKEIKQDRLTAVQTAFQEKLQAQQRVNVIDPEFKAYWQLMSASNARTPQEYAKQMGLAIAALKTANTARPNNYIQMQLARLLDQDGKTAEAVRILYPMLEGKNASVEGADLRMLLGDMLLKTGVKEDKERAIQQYEIASEVAPHDPQVHQQLVVKFQQLQRPDLVAKEQAWMANYKKQMAQFAERQKRQTPQPSAPPKE